jgi:hypothetical protein
MLLDYCRTDGCLVLVRSSPEWCARASVVLGPLLDSSPTAASSFHVLSPSLCCSVFLFLSSWCWFNQRTELMRKETSSQSTFPPWRLYCIYMRLVVPDGRPRRSKVKASTLRECMRQTTNWFNSRHLHNKLWIKLEIDIGLDTIVQQVQTYQLKADERFYWCKWQLV